MFFIKTMDWNACKNILSKQLKVWNVMQSVIIDFIVGSIVWPDGKNGLATQADYDSIMMAD